MSELWWLVEIRPFSGSEFDDYKWEILAVNQPTNIGFEERFFSALGPPREKLVRFATLAGAVNWCGTNVQNPWHAVVFLAKLVEQAPVSANGSGQ